MNPVIDSPRQNTGRPAPDTAVVLAGGLGTRLRAVLSDQPKILAPVGGVPFLDYLLGYLKAQGVQLVILSVGYRASQVRDYASDRKGWGLEIAYSYEEAPLGTGGALRLASQGLERPFFCLNGDSFSTVNLTDMWVSYQTADAGATIALQQIELSLEDIHQRGCVRVDERWKILSFAEKPSLQENQDLSRKVYINIGVYLFDPAALDYLAPGQPASLELEVFPRLAAQEKLFGYLHTGYFKDIGTPASLAEFAVDIASGRVQAA